MAPRHLFAYGTLQPGRLRWPFLAPFATEHRPATVRGRLLDTGNGWPVAVFGDGAGDGEVPGTLVGLAEDRLDEALGVLDAVEATATDVLARVVVTTVDGVVAWAYDCARPEPAWTAIAVWAGVDER